MLSIRSKDLFEKNQHLIDLNIQKGFKEGSFSIEQEIADGSKEINAI